MPILTNDGYDSSLSSYCTTSTCHTTFVTTSTWALWGTTSASTLYVSYGLNDWAARTQRFDASQAEESALRARASLDDRRRAQRRASVLLRSVLSAEQWAEMRDYHRFTVTAPSGRRYHIWVNRGRHGNIEELDETGCPVRELCGAPGGRLPEADVFAAQKLCLELDEDEFRRRANITTLLVAA